MPGSYYGEHDSSPVFKHLQEVQEISYFASTLCLICKNCRGVFDHHLQSIAYVGDNKGFFS